MAFPYLATDRIKRLRWGASWRLDKTQNDLQKLPPMVCVAKQKGAMRLTSLDISAQSHRLREGQGVTEARAICPDLDIIPSDDAADLAFLNALADWADRYTPLIGIDAPFGKPQGLFLDITGCAHLFGGEAEMLKDIISRFDKMGIYAQGSIAPTPGLAWGLARQYEYYDHITENAIMNWDNLDARFRQFPMAALRLPLDMLLALDRVGLKKVKDIISAPRKPLMRRFGPLLLKRLDQALGREEEPVSPRLPVSDLSVERRLAEPIGRQEDIETCIEQLSNSLRVDLEKRGQAGQEFMLLLFRMDGIVRRIIIGLSAPSRDAKRIRALFSQKLAAIYDETDAGAGFETIRLCVIQAVDKSDVQESFVNGSNVQTNMHQLADQITARLGKDSVVKPVFHQSFIPERAASFAPIIEHKEHHEAILQNNHDERPIRLFSNPEPVTAIAEVPEGPPIRFKWRRSQYQVARAEGPERIGAEWWIDGESAQTRDYYRVEDKSGRRFWIFRQGLYERETHLSDGLLPKWFMHGLFA
ncbi:MAG: DNA polymerase Y family protein [Lentilitoribacter sp.]